MVKFMRMTSHHRFAELYLLLNWRFSSPLSSLSISFRFAWCQRSFRILSSYLERGHNITDKPYIIPIWIWYLGFLFWVWGIQNTDHHSPTHYWPDNSENYSMFDLCFKEILADAQIRIRCHLTVEAKLFDGGVEEEDDGEGRRQDGVVVEVLPPDACPARFNCQMWSSESESEKWKKVKVKSGRGTSTRCLPCKIQLWKVVKWKWKVKVKKWKWKVVEVLPPDARPDHSTLKSTRHSRCGDLERWEYKGKKKTWRISTVCQHLSLFCGRCSPSALSAHWWWVISSSFHFDLDWWTPQENNEDDELVNSPEDVARHIRNLGIERKKKVTGLC